MALRIGMHTGVQDVSYPDLRKLWQIADSNGFLLGEDPSGTTSTKIPPRTAKALASRLRRQ